MLLFMPQIRMPMQAEGVMKLPLQASRMLYQTREDIKIRSCGKWRSCVYKLNDYGFQYHHPKGMFHKGDHILTTAFGT